MENYLVRQTEFILECYYLKVNHLKPLSIWYSLKQIYKDMHTMVMIKKLCITIRAIKKIKIAEGHRLSWNSITEINAVLLRKNELLKF